MLHGHLSNMYKLLTTVGEFNLQELPVELVSTLKHLHTELACYQQPSDSNGQQHSANELTNENAGLHDQLTNQISACNSINVTPNELHNQRPDVIPVAPPLPPCNVANLDKSDYSYTESPLCSPSGSRSITESPCGSRSILQSPRSSRRFKTSRPSSCYNTPARRLRRRLLHHVTAKVPMNVDLIRGRDSLRKVPGFKSPGGTPVREKKEVFFTSHPSDLMAYALQEKFKNMRQLYNSPNASDNSLEQSFDTSID